MKKLVDSNFDPHEVVESNPLKPETKSNSKTIVVMLVIGLLIAIFGFLIYNYNKNKEDGPKGK